jgi:hypothetical protein
MSIYNKDDIIYNIHNNKLININLFYCNYNLMNNNELLKLPLTYIFIITKHLSIIL